jgi:hypothetical protein
MSRRPGANLMGASQLDPVRFHAAFYQSPVLRVPSVIVPREHNFVLLPEAVGFEAKIEWVESLSFDRRLFTMIGH